METLRFAIQKSGRLRDGTVDLVQKLGVRINRNRDLLHYQSTNFPIEFLFLRDDDIPGYVDQAVADVGIVGQNVISETKTNVKIERELGFANCRLSIAVPNASPAQSLKDLEGKRIATTYPNILTNYANQNNVSISTHYISGSAEIAPSIKLADAICDLVSTGSTLLQNGLKEIETIMHSQAVLITSPELSESKKTALDNFLFRLDAVLKAQGYNYIAFNAPKDIIPEIVKVLPGLKGPTINDLADPKWCAVGTVVKEEDFWTALEKLKELGATGILILPIEKMVL